MIPTIQVIALLLVSMPMALSLAHALEYPGKLRLPKEEYLAVQKIYYPGFTLGGIAEPVSVLVLGMLAFVVRDMGAVFWLTLGALVAMAALTAVYWLMTHPVNNFWVKDVKLQGAGKRFFGLNTSAQHGEAPDWTELRDRWEFSHLVRAALGVIALLLLTISLVV